MTKNTFKIILPVIIFALALTPTVFAETDPNDVTVKPWLKLKEKRQEMIKVRCETLTERIDTKISKYQNNIDNREEVHSKVIERITKVITVAKEKGLDTSKLEVDLKTFEDKVDVIAANYDTLIEKLKQSKVFACGESEGQFASTVKTAVAELKDLRTSISDAHTFYKETIRPDITDLKKQWGNKTGQDKVED